MKISKLNLMCFSPTGGTKLIAKLLAEHMQMESEITDITARCPEKSFKEDELTVFAFPCYGGRIPTPLYERMEHLKGNKTPALLLCVFGNRAVDDAFAEMQDLSEEKGFVTVAAAEFIAPHSVDKSYAASRPDTADMVIMDEFAERLRNKLWNMKQPESISLPGNRPYVKYGGIPIKPAFKEKNCINCGLCYAHCPTGAINIKKPRKFDKGKCISCMGCVSVCSEGARYIPGPMKLAGKMFLKKACSERKEPKYYL